MRSTTTIIMMLYFIRGSLEHVLQQSPIVGIAGGHPVNIEDAPFMAAVLKLFTDNTNITSSWCGGSIIHQQFVLTAASCIDERLIVRVGSPNSDEGILHEVEHYIKHESFTYDAYDNDVALLKLLKPVTFGPSVAAIKLADDTVNITTGLTANVTGWGETEDGRVSHELQQASAMVSPPGDCDEYYHTFGIKLTDKQICVNNAGKGACNFDRGGPLTAGDLQIGIDSIGSSCGHIPNVYVKVAPHLQWIQDKINLNL